MISVLTELGWSALEWLGEVCIRCEPSLVEEFMKWEQPLV